MGWGQRDPALERRWRDQMAKWRTSGLSVRAFCEQRRLSEACFYYWKRELRARDAAASPVGEKSSLGKESRPLFVPLTVTPGNGNRKGNHFGRRKGAGSAIEKGTTCLTRY